MSERSEGNERARQRRLDALLDEALGLGADARAAWLQRLREDDAGLAEALAELLALTTQAEAALPGSDSDGRWAALHAGLAASLAPAPAHSAETSATQAGRDMAAASDSDAIGGVATADLPASAGGWRPLRRIGHGGMGTVYLAEREIDGFRQTGALKSLRPGAESEQLLHRFLEERRILAGLHHPGIARMLDGGRDADGRPFLVMEYVAGERIDLVCDRRRLDIEQRVAVFRAVAQAVAHAHRSLVAHRDIKPGNILVGDDLQPKLLDFGIAKALSPDAGDAEANPATRTALPVFTPDYAAPEQVLGHATSTATDVYQLGLLLYELLTGHRAQQVRDRSLAAVHAAICDAIPAPPSERIADDDLALAEARASTPRGLRRRLRGDLDTIVLKALRKEPERRYGSVAALIEDLDRWRQGLPVRARPETWVYRSGKFVRRHAWAVAAGAAMLAMIVGYATTVTLQAGALARERDRAQAEAEKSRQTLSLLKRVFALSDPRATGGVPLSAREALDAGWASIQNELGGQPEVEVEVVDAVGEAYLRTGDFKRARALFERNLATAHALHPPQMPVLARARRNYGRALSELADFDRAQTQFDAALADYRNIHGERHAEVAQTLADLAQLRSRRGDQAGAESTYRDVLAMRRETYGERHPLVAESLSLLAMTLRQQGDYAGAEPLLEQALTLRRQLLPAEHPDLHTSLSNLAMIRNDLGESDTAERLYREAVAGMRAALGEDHPEVAIVMCNLGRLLQARRDHAGARALFEDALRIRRKALGERHPMTAENLNDLGLLLADSGDADGAEAHYRQALAAYPQDHKGRGATIFNLGRLAENRRQYPAAERLYREALALQRRDYGEDHDRVGADLNRLGVVLHRQGRLDEAESAMRQALAIYRKRFPPGHARLAAVLTPLGELMLERGRREEATAMLREAYDARMRAFGETDKRTLETGKALARAVQGD